MARPVGRCREDGCDAVLSVASDAWVGCTSGGSGGNEWAGYRTVAGADEAGPGKGSEATLPTFLCAELDEAGALGGQLRKAYEHAFR